MNANTTFSTAITPTPDASPDASTRLPVTDALAELAARYEAKWPEICYAKGGSRARKAMQFVIEGRIHPDGHDLQTGHDIWVVNGNRCSKAGKWCECEDRIRTDATYGKLCAHRLAVALKTHWLGDRNDELTGAIFGLVDYERTRLDLLVERTYAYHGDGERTVLVGWIDPQQRRQLWPVRLRIAFTLPQFQHALTTLGWSLADLPEKLPGVQDHYCYPIHNQPGLDLTPELFYHKGRTELMVERERSRKMLLADIAANLPDILAGPLPLTLSDWEAKRVVALRQEMLSQQATAAAVWSRLPEAVRLAILEASQ